VRIIAQAVRRESEIKRTFRSNVVGKTPNRGEVCLSLREWREVELTYPRKQAYCGKNCGLDQCILLDGPQNDRVHDIRMAEQTPALFAKAERKWRRCIDCLSILDRCVRVRTRCGQKAMELDELIKKLSEHVSRPLTLPFSVAVFRVARFRACCQ
jgi:hypothetical protein